MCIVFYTLSQPGYRLILIANRDEYLDRPASPAGWHCFEPLAEHGALSTTSDAPSKAWVLSGRDLGSKSGGTWLGITRDLRVGVITNLLPPVAAPGPSPPSRGVLLKDFLEPAPGPRLPSVPDYLQRHTAQAAAYDGFNLLLFKLKRRHGGWDEPEVGYQSNQPEPTCVDLQATSTPGIDDEAVPGTSGVRCQACGLSNSPLSMPWPKVTRGQEKMAENLAEWTKKEENEGALIERMMALLQHSVRARYDYAELSETTRVQPMIVTPRRSDQGRWYGTRLSTVILVKDDGEVTFVERDIAVLNASGQVEEGIRKKDRVFRFQSTP